MILQFGSKADQRGGYTLRGCTGTTHKQTNTHPVGPKECMEGECM